MLRLNKLTDYAVVMLCHMGMARDDVFTVPQLASDSGVPQPTVAKLMKQLGRAGVVTSQRGASGGYSLSRPPAEIAISDVITALEGPISLTACVDGADDSCDSMAMCPMSGNWNKVNQAIRHALDGVTLADMTPDPLAIFAAPGEFNSPAAR
jgi:FeS assembly SUF system regulator